MTTCNRRWVESFAAALFLALSGWYSGSQAYAATPMSYIYNAPETASDTRYQYHIEILRAALETTRGGYGDFEFKPSVPMSEERQVSELKNGTGTITVLVRGFTEDYAKLLRPVPVSLDKGILGYRVLLIRQQDQKRFSAVRTLEDLRAFTIGQGASWKDVKILESNGLRVVTGPVYDGLFEMLVKRRFDAFSRGINEIVDEYEARKAKLPDIAIEKDLLLYYPLPRYYWFSQNDHGKALANRVEAGLQKLIRDGTLDRAFRKYYRDKLEKLDLSKRRLIDLRNPYLPPEMAPTTPEPLLVSDFK